MSTYEGAGDRLVCGVDGSKHSADVVAVASQLAKRLGLRLQVVHSAHRDVYVVGRERDALLATGRALLADLAASVAPGDRIVELGDPADLLRAALDEDAALAVVGSRGLGAAKTAVLGSVSRALAGSARCPVVIVPPLASIHLAANPVVICGVDGSESSAVALDHAAALAAALGGRLTAVNVRTEPSRLAAIASLGAGAILPVDYARVAGDALAARQAAQSVVKSAATRLDEGMTIRLRIEQGDAAVRLRAVAAEYPSAILVVGSCGRGFRSLLGSVCSQLAANAPAPVMVIPPGLATRPVIHDPVSSEEHDPAPSAANSAAGWQVPLRT